MASHTNINHDQVAVATDRSPKPKEAAMSHTNGKVARPRFAALITAVSMMMFTVAAIATHSPASASQVPTCGPNGYDLHYRLYGANGYRLGYDPGWGFYAIGSIHYDVYEGSSGQWFGANEQAENYLGQVAAYNGYPYGWYLYPGTGSS